LPPGAGRPAISDDFGDVFGFQLAVIGDDGFSYAELEAYAKDIKKELSIVEDVARVDLWGVQQKVVYLDVSETQLSQLGLTEASLTSTLERQNGNCQGNCRLDGLTHAAFSNVAGLSLSSDLSGFKYTSSTGSQLRVSRLQRSG